MLPAAERLRRDSLFQRAYAGRMSIASPLLTVYVLPRQPRSARRLPLVGFVAGKKVHSKAAYRNRAKRRVREAYRQSRAALPGLKQWYAVVFVVHGQVLTAPWEEVIKTMEECLAKADKKYGQEARHLGGRDLP